MLLPSSFLVPGTVSGVVEWEVIEFCLLHDVRGVPVHVLLSVVYIFMNIILVTLKCTTVVHAVQVSLFSGRRKAVTRAVHKSAAAAEATGCLICFPPTTWESLIGSLVFSSTLRRLFLACCGCHIYKCHRLHTTKHPN